jgi:hypothetical protein
MKDHLVVKHFCSEQDHEKGIKKNGWFSQTCPPLGN